MRFEVLGRVRARDGTRTVALDRPRQRAVLGYLLLSPNRPVPISELVEAVWAGAEPTTARNQIRSDIAAIRRRLRAPDGDAVPAGDPAGYRVPVGPGELDLEVFTDLVGRAEASTAAGHRDDAIRLLRQALALWQGDPLADAQAAFVEAARARLVQHRLAAHEALADAELAAGRHQEVVDELAALVVAHPTRERLVGLHMLALYRCGQVEEALHEGRRYRQRLAQDQGLDPGSAHDDLERAILRRDTSLEPATPESVTATAESVTAEPPTAERTTGPPATTAVASRVKAPAQLPAAIPGFAGRESVLERLRALVAPARSGDDSSTVIVAVDGAAGVGKTTLALRWAHEVTPAYPDGQLYVNLRGHSTEAPLAPVDALAQLLRSLGLSPHQVPDEVDEASALYRSMLSGGRHLILLDNAASAEQVRPLLPGATGAHAIVTSRARLTGLAVRDGAETISLDVLTPPESLELLSRLIGEDRVRAEPGETAELAVLCAYLPLALCIAAARVREQPPRSVASYLAELRADRLTALAIPQDDAAALRSTFALSHRAMEPDTARLFRLLGLVPGADFPAEAAAALAGLAPAAASPLLRRLYTAHVLERTGEGRYGLHDLLRDYAGELADGEPTRVDAEGRLYGWYVGMARAAAAQAYPHMLRLPLDDPPAVPDFPGGTEAMAWLDVEFPNLVEAIRTGARRGRPAAVWLLADALRGYLLRRSHLGEWLMIAGTGLAAAQEAGDERAQLAMHLNLSLAHRNRGDYPRTIAHLRDAERLAGSSRWADGELTALGNLAGAYYDIGSLAEAGELFARVLDLSRRLDRPGNTAAILSNLGATLRDLGRPAEALVLLTEAVELFREIGSRPGEADALDNVGTTQRELGNLTEALDALGAALAIQRELGDGRAEASVLTNQAAVWCEAGRVDEAYAGIQRAVELAVTSGSVRTEVEALIVAAEVHRALGRGPEGLRLAERAHRLAVEVQVRQPEIAALIGLAAAHRASGSADRAVEIARQARRLAGTHGFVFLAQRADRLVATG